MTPIYSVNELKRNIVEMVFIYWQLDVNILKNAREAIDISKDDIFSVHSQVKTVLSLPSMIFPKTFSHWNRGRRAPLHFTYLLVYIYFWH